MQVFIDESGSFSGYHEGSLSVVGALCIPDGLMPKITRKYLKLRKILPMEKGEVKGRLLSEQEVEKVVRLLVKNQAIFEVAAIDIGMHSASGVITYRDQLADNMEKRVKYFNAATQPKVLHAVRQIKQTPPPLFLQAMTTWDVIQNIIMHIPMYFAQRQPHELATFKWIADAKDSMHKTDWEEWWSTYCQGVLATRSKNNPALVLEGANYSYFKNFDATTNHSKMGTDLKLLLADIRFSAKPEPGLELVDIVTNAVRRAMVGNLSKDGWKNIPRLMIHRPEHYITLIRLEGVSTSAIKPNYTEVIQHFSRGGKSMLTRRNLALAHL